MQDISEYYDLEKSKLEEEAWIKERFYERNASQLLHFIHSLNAKSVIEFGCGSGWVPTLLPEDVSYTGVDKNEHFLNMARHKNLSTREFIQSDIRKFSHINTFDVSTAWAFIKHFSLEEVVPILTKILRFGHYSMFEMNISKENYDDGIDFHHTFVTMKTLEKAFRLASKKEIYRIKTWEGQTEAGFPFEVYTFAVQPVELR